MFSEFDYNEVNNSVTDSKTFNRDNVYYMNLINETGFSITVIDRNAGEIIIPAGKERKFHGHPLYPTNVNFKVRFNNAAPVTDLLTIITSQTNGRSEQC